MSEQGMKAVIDPARIGRKGVPRHWQAFNIKETDLPTKLVPVDSLPSSAEGPGAPAYVPLIISDRQFAQGCALRGYITESEAIDWVSNGSLPVAIANFVSTLPDDQQFAANMLLKGATQFDRDNWLTPVFGQLVGLDDEGLNQFWNFCAAL